MTRANGVALRLLACVVVLAAAGCAQPGRVPVTEHSPVLRSAPASYVVRSGDTLYSIAWRFGLDYRGLARANGLRAPYTIYVGQSLRVVQAAPRTSGKPTAPAASAPPRSKSLVPGWRPPADAPVARAYGAGNKGIDYALEPGHKVRATAAGEVVYAGSGLGGFLHLVIVKHDPSYLSAYSLDGPVSVREGQSVKAGEALADTLRRGRKNGMLHFEIRRNGDPVDPGSLIGH